MTDHEIFLSYSWNDEEIANEIDSMFSLYSISLIRDVRDLKYKQSLSEFMKKVRITDYVIMIISESYLTSKNCMFEVMEFIKDESFKQRILPFIHEETEIFSPEGKLKYLSYWNNNYSTLKQKIDTLDNVETIPLISELKKYDRIKKEIIEFLDTLSDINSIVYRLTIDKNMMSKAFDYLGLTTYETEKYTLLLKINEEIGIEGIFNEFKNIPQVLSEFINERNDGNLRYELYLDVNKDYDEISLRKKITKILVKFGASIEELYKFDESYLILSKVKTDLFKDKKTFIWWCPFFQYYTDDVKKAGLYNKKQVENVIYRKGGFEDHSSVGILKKKFDKEIGLQIVPNSSHYRYKILDDHDYIIGDDNWDSKDYYRENGIPRYKLFDYEETDEDDN